MKVNKNFRSTRVQILFLAFETVIHVKFTKQQPTSHVRLHLS